MNKTNFVQLAGTITDEIAAYQYLEQSRWGGCPVCAHCDSDNVALLNPMNGVSRKTRTGAMSVRRVWKCRDCRKQFSVLTDTVMHGTKISIRTWVLVMFEMCASKNGVSAREIERKYGLTSRSAWFLTQRIREAMGEDATVLPPLMTGTVIADETFIGGKERNKHANKRAPKGSSPHQGKQAVVSMVARESGEVRSMLVQRVSARTLADVLRSNVSREATLHTDENPSYHEIGRFFVGGHGRVNHSQGEYVREGVTTNQIEGFFSQLKRGLDGTHHHVTVKHLQSYLDEFGWRYTTRKATDGERYATLIRRTGGRRLDYATLTGVA